MTFANSADYDKIQPDDKLSLLDLNDLAPGKVNKQSGFSSLLNGVASRGMFSTCVYSPNLLATEWEGGTSLMISFALRPN